MRALVTGANGFIGTQLVQALCTRGDKVFALVRKNSPEFADVEMRHADLARIETIEGKCVNAETVFHLAGYAHAGDANDPAAAAIHESVTVNGTRALLREAQRAGVRRFIFVSSTKAMGEGAADCLDETHIPQPATAYGRAKLAAEDLVHAAGRSGLEVCVLRLPLVYGRDSKGNISRMMAAIDRGRLPPLPNLPNKRSMVHVDDVSRALLLAAERAEAVSQTYIVTDVEVYSTRRIYTAICRALGRSVPSWAVPATALRLGALAGDVITRVRGKPFFLNSEILEKLTGSAWYSSDKIRRELGFRSQQSLESALPQMVARYREACAHAA